MKDYYHILRVNEYASDKQVKSAYRRLAKKYHPDKNGKVEDHTLFLEINEAYQVLSNTKEKQKYDLDRSLFYPKKPARTKSDRHRTTYNKPKRKPTANKKNSNSENFTQLFAVFFKKVSWFNFFFALLIIVDFYLPSFHFSEKMISYASGEDNSIVLITKNTHFPISYSNYKRYIKSHTLLNVEITPILHSSTSLHVDTKQGFINITPVNSLYYDWNYYLLCMVVASIIGITIKDNKHRIIFFGVANSYLLVMVLLILFSW